MVTLIVLAALALLLTTAALWILAAVYVFSDARKRRLPSARAWGLGTLLTGPIGLIAYLVDRPSSRRTPCRFCGETILETDPQCPYCGRERSSGFPHEHREPGRPS